LDRVKRGDVVVVAVGDYGKPRPALIVQADYFNETHGSITIAPITSPLVDAPLFRLTIEPSPQSGLRSVSQIMIDKITTIRRDKIGKRIGHVEEDTIRRANRAIALWFGLGN
jgi:mRNA interferase MazF